MLAGREFYVKELQRHIPVDVFGLCGDLRCGKNHMDVECYSDVLQPNYKFYLSFENNLCQDYITEKVCKRRGLSKYCQICIVLENGAREMLPENYFIFFSLITARPFNGIAAAEGVAGAAVRAGAGGVRGCPLRRLPATSLLRGRDCPHTPPAG